MRAAACAHLSQALHKMAHEREQDTAALYVALLQFNEEKIPPNLIQAMHTMMSKQCLNPADITLLYQVQEMSLPTSFDVNYCLFSHILL